MQNKAKSYGWSMHSQNQEFQIKSDWNFWFLWEWNLVNYTRQRAYLYDRVAYAL